MLQNIITKTPLSQLGYDFVAKEYLHQGEDEYYQRDFQDKSGIDYRKLTAYEIEVLVRNANTSDDWNNILVSNAFNPELVKNCRFYGFVRIGKLEPFCLGFSDLKIPVGLYNSTIISCDFGDNVVVNNVNYMSHYIIGNEAIIVNVNELVTTSQAKFGNGIVKDGEDESIRIWMELCNENGGRKVIPFNGMLAGDAYLWSKYRDDEELLQKFKAFTESKFNTRRGYYGKVGHRTVIKNARIIKDVWIGNDAYIKGPNKLKNLTINSGDEGRTQIGEGCELVNGIIGFGCRIFYGVKAVRFVMASHSQLKYGARLLNSYLGHNATISCCEVLNSLIFPAHEQHHNNSFLCAALVMGQSNIAAGVTIGSNHNSRAADGEIIAGRGFWPGLCVSLKHNSKFASFTILAKGDYPAELNITTPFSLVSNDVSNDQLLVMPGYWFMYNMYALARNESKYVDRDKRVEKTQHLEYDFLAPDTINEMFDSLELFKECTGKAFYKSIDAATVYSKEDCIKKGKQLLDDNDDIVNTLQITASGFENTKRKVVLLKVLQCYHLFKKLIAYYGVINIVQSLQKNKIKNWEAVAKLVSAKTKRDSWLNIGGQLIPAIEVENLKSNIKKGKLNSWDEMHLFYTNEGIKYDARKTNHAIASLLEITGLNAKKLSKEQFIILLKDAVALKTKMVNDIYDSRAKDYDNAFKKMVYNNQQEMNEVVGNIDDNAFIKEQQKELQVFKSGISKLQKSLNL